MYSVPTMKNERLFEKKREFTVFLRRSPLADGRTDDGRWQVAYDAFVPAEEADSVGAVEWMSNEPAGHLHWVPITWATWNGKDRGHEDKIRRGAFLKLVNKHFPETRGFEEVNPLWNIVDKKVSDVDILTTIYMS